MSHLESAKAAIQAELTHTREGLSFYQWRIDALEKTLLQLASVGAGSIGVPAVTTTILARSAPKVVVAKPAKSVKQVRPAMNAKGAKQATGGNMLPFTGGDYWPNLVIDKPRSASEILETSIGSLGFKPAKPQIQKLAGRMTFALNALVKTKTIQDSGSGRDRRFFKVR